MTVTVWTVMAAVALVWPSRLAGPLDGAPLDGIAEAIAIGLVIPALWWLCRDAILARWSRVAIVGLLAWKVAMTLLLAQQGWCVAMSAGRPLDGINQGIPIVEPAGALRSWDMRADWRAAAPRCTAIVTKPLREQREFPAWFLNVTSQLKGSADVLMSARGYVTIASPRTLDVSTTASNPVLRVDGRTAAIPAMVPAGTHAIEIAATLTGGDWRFVPTLDRAPLTSAALVTTDSPGAIDRWLSGWGSWITAAFVTLLMVSLAVRAATSLAMPAMMVAGVIAIAIVAGVLGAVPQQGLQRLAGPILFAAVLIPAGSRLRNLRGAFLLIAVPWLAFIAVLSVKQIGRFTLYSYDDWLTYQVASHRIYFQGYWLEGGNEVFDFQPLYRWMTGPLHLLFGDSSVGELYWDGACLLVGALLAFYVTRAVVGFRLGLAAAAATLATTTIGTPWYFLGRGLSEIAAAGWGFVAMFFLLRGRRGSQAWVATAGVLAVLMFYTRLNHLLWAFFLPAFLLSCRTPIAWAELAAAARRFRVRRAALFAAIFASGVAAFAWRTYHYTGVFSVFYGTSLKNNDTGLRPWTLFDGSVWGRVAHSLQATVFMNEPPRPDPRAIFLVAGTLLALVGLVQMPVARRAPALLVVALAGSYAAALLAHAHGYPGRFSIHIVPLACAITMVFASQFSRARA
jgi:hypothetical protein